MQKKKRLLRFLALGIALIISLLMITNAIPSTAAPQVVAAAVGKPNQKELFKPSHSFFDSAAKSELIQVIALTCPSFPYTVPAGNVTDLINAIACANSNGAGTNDVINLTNSTYTLTAVNNVIGGDNGLPMIASATTAGTLTINGNGATIRRGTAGSVPQFRLFYIDDGANLTLNQLTLRNGRADSGFGGAIYNGYTSTLTVNNSTITSNSADTGGGIYNFVGVLALNNSNITSNTATAGGAIYQLSGSLTMSNTTLSGNSASEGGAIYNIYNEATVSNSTFTSNSAGTGGAIYNRTNGSLSVYNSIFTGNTATNNGGSIYNGDYGTANVDLSTLSNNSSYRGGAIENYGGWLTIDQSTFTSNVASGSYYGGGGVYNDGGGTAAISNSTFNGNAATGADFAGGGAILNNSNTSTVTLSNSTLSGNTATNSNGYAGGIGNIYGTVTVSNSTISGNLASQYGGGINNGPGVLNLGSSIVAGNTESALPGDMFGTITSLGYNVIENTGSATLTGTTTNNLLNGAASPLNLGALADNGGLTQTMALGVGSVAIGNGNCDSLASVGPVYYDQRGAHRSYPCASGAYERGALGGTPTDCATQTDIPQGECQALLDFFNSTSGTLWFVKTGWNTDQFPCNWYGVACSGGHVIQLNLWGNGLFGSLPATLGNLSQLQALILYSNSLYGSIPPSIGNMTSLIALSLQENQLTGAIPSEIGNLVNLDTFFLNNNQLGGSIPATLGNLVSVHAIYLYNNQLTGAIPGSLGNLTQLQWLDLHQNQLSSSIPTTLGNLVNLQGLFLWGNQLIGSIPTQLGSLISLKNLMLSNNQLSGTIPSSLGNLSGLQYLYLNNNQLTGSIPTQLGNLAALQYLYLSNNQLTGSIPTQLGNLSNLQQLYLNNNLLTGSIPGQLGNLTNLQQLYLNDNGLSGAIPSGVGNLVNLQYLYLNNNALSGVVPTTIKNLTQMWWLDICGGNDIGSDNASVNDFLNNRIFGWSPQNSCLPRMTVSSIQNILDGTFPVSTVDVVLSEQARIATFTADDITLTRDGTPVTLPSSVTVSLLDALTNTYRISGLSAFTTTLGDYALTVATTGMLEQSGLKGSNSGVTETWSDDVYIDCNVGQLINAINTLPSGSTIHLAWNCVYSLTTPFAGVDGLPTINKTLTIVGNDATITRNSASAFRIFNVSAAGNLTVSRLRVLNGLLTGAGTGAGFYNEGSLTVNESCIVGNIAPQGGGIFNAAGTAVNAVSNWWGDDSGPSGNAFGSGDAISANVNYLPFKSTAPDGCGQRGVPANDLLDTPTEIGSLPYNTSQDVNGSTVNTNEPFFSCAANRTNTAWYRYTPSTEQLVTFATTGSSYNTVLAVYEGAYAGSYAGFVEIGCNDNPASGQQAVLQVPLTAGTTYFIQIAKVGNAPLTSAATLNLSISAALSVVDPIFSNGFESGDLSGWTANVNDSGDLSVTSSAALMGGFGMQAVIDDIVAIHITDDTPDAEARYRARFMFDPNSLTMATNDNFVLLYGYQGTNTAVLQLQMRYSGGSYQLRAGAADDGGTFVFGGYVTISDAPHLIELDWQAAANDGANNGSLTLWIDEAQQTPLTGLNNDTRRIDRVRLGAVAGIDAGTNGTVYFDAFVSRRQTYIGYLLPAPALSSPADAAQVAREAAPSLKWNAVIGATQYYAEFSNGTTVNLNSGWISGRNWSPGLQPQGVYTWRVKARSTSGEESNWSVSRTLTVRPGVPTNLQGTAVSPTRVNLTWTASIDAPTGITGYRIYREGALIGSSNSSTPSFTDNAAAACAANNYKVRTIKGTLSSPDSTTITVSTPCDAIFSDGFESGNLSAWSANASGGGDLSVTTAAHLTTSTYGLQAVINDTTPIHVTDNTPNAEVRYRARFYFDPNSISMGTNETMFLFFGYQPDSTVAFRLQLRRTAISYQLRTGLLRDNATTVYGAFVNISDAPHLVEIDWQAASGVGANNGSLTLWIDEVQKTAQTGIDNDTIRIDRVRLGAVTGIQAGTGGTLYFDAFRSTRLSYIGAEIGGLGVFDEPTAEPTKEIMPEVTPEATVEPTAEVTPEATVEVTPEVTAEPTIEPTAEATSEVTVEPTLEPTASPTVEPTAMPTIEPTLLPFSVPVYQTMDDGAPLWSASAGWQLSADAAYSGLGWQAAASGNVETLAFRVSVNLAGATTPTLSFQSKLVSGVLPEVRISLDGATWLTVASVTPSLNWTSVTVDLTAYAGQTVQVQFLWATPAGAGDTWQVDEVTIADGAVPPPVEPTIAPTEPAVTVTPDAPGNEPPVYIPTPQPREGGAAPDAPADLPSSATG